MAFLAVFRELLFEVGMNLCVARIAAVEAGNKVARVFTFMHEGHQHTDW